ncbi:MAG: bifunctional demethylmenaquinone methyltransferase/2-methoxy-6-polyprenyl-1,4-benzoquinol methylase UbiE [Bacteroidia bacterium]|nr:bifunctional demethylmenaquinone methyltransferase/2-methoxy-6-polyprenyl-1,4-benzoquinol methylase UbiE [Bacteroidia bacterium]
MYEQKLDNPVTPYGKAGQSKKSEVTEMFDNIAPRYDLLNRALTFRLDVGWRRKAVRMLRPYQPKTVVDIATGTADFAIEARSLHPERIIGIDISAEMLRIGREKIAARSLGGLIELRQGDSEALDLPDGSADAVTVGFGVRNFENLDLGLREICRILRPGGALAVLEPSFPVGFPARQLFQLYFGVVTPFIGKLVSGDSSAYRYLPASVQAFPHGEAFLERCRQAGFRKGQFLSLGFGACALYLLEK